MAWGGGGLGGGFHPFGRGVSSSRGSAWRAVTSARSCAWRVSRNVLRWGMCGRTGGGERAERAGGGRGKWAWECQQAAHTSCARGFVESSVAAVAAADTRREVGEKAVAVAGARARVRGVAFRPPRPDRRAARRGAGSRSRRSSARGVTPALGADHVRARGVRARIEARRDRARAGDESERGVPERDLALRDGRDGEDALALVGVVASARLHARGLAEGVREQHVHDDGGVEGVGAFDKLRNPRAAGTDEEGAGARALDVESAVA